MSGIVSDKQQYDGFYDEIVARRVIREKTYGTHLSASSGILLILSKKSTADSLDGSPKSLHCRFEKRSWFVIATFAKEGRSKE